MYDRLHKLGLCISHKTATSVNKILGQNHDSKVFEWKAQAVKSPGFTLHTHTGEMRRVVVPSFVLQGDNYDTLVQVCDMRSDSQNRSLHYFNSIAVKDRVAPEPPNQDQGGSQSQDQGGSQSQDQGGSQSQDQGGSQSQDQGESGHHKLESASLSTFLPSVDDCSALRDGYITLISRVLVENLSFLSTFKQCVPQYSLHKYSEEMAKKSEMVG